MNKIMLLTLMPKEDWHNYLVMSIFKTILLWRKGKAIFLNVALTCSYRM